MTFAAIVPTCRNALGLKYPLELHGLPNGKTPFEVTLSQVTAAPVEAVYVPAPVAVIADLAARYGREFNGRPVVYLELEPGDGQDLLRAVTRGCFAAASALNVDRFVVVPPGYAYSFDGLIKAVCEAGAPIVGALKEANTQTRPDFNVNADKNIVTSFGLIEREATHAGTIGPFTLTNEELKRLRKYRKGAITECAPVADRAALALALNIDLKNGNPYVGLGLPGKVWDLSNWPGLNWYQADVMEGKAN